MDSFLRAPEDAQVRFEQWHFEQRLREINLQKGVHPSKLKLPDFDKDFEFKTFTNVDDLLNALYLGLSDQMCIEKNTRNQSFSSKWFRMRGTRITASRFGQVLSEQNCNYLMTCKENHTLSQMQTETESNSSKVLADNKMSSGPVQKSNQAMLWGIHNEDQALKSYAQLKGLHFETDIIKPGIMIESSGMLGGTPDGIVRHRNVMIEAKCPYSKRDVKNWPDFIDTWHFKKFWVKRTSSGDFALDKSTPQGRNYYHQIQGCMYILYGIYNNPQISCDLVLWTPYDTLIINVPFELEWAQNAVILRRIFLSQMADYIIREKIPMVSVLMFLLFFFFFLIGRV